MRGHIKQPSRPGGPIAVLLHLAFLLLPGLAFAQETFFVDPAGDDGHPGTAGQPLRTFAGTASKVRGVLDGTGDVEVVFRSGTYLFDRTVVLGPTDSGSPQQAITYRAAPGATPVFTSLLPLHGWEPWSGPILRAPLPAGIDHVRYLHDGDVAWLPRSATEPFVADEDGFCIECTWDDPAFQDNKSNIRYPAGFDAPSWARAGQYDLRESQHAWTMEILPIASVDAGQRRIVTQLPALYEMRRDTSESDIPNNNWVLNSLEGITEPGEWASLDGEIYLWPMIDTDGIAVPTLVELIRIDDGTSDGNAAVAAPVENIHFDGIIFTGGDFYVMQPDDVVVGNALIDTCQGRGFLVNGYVYVSGFQRHATNVLERNYIHDRSDNLQNNMVFYSDSDQDNCEYIGNMVRGLTIGDAPAPFPLYVVVAQWPESDPATPSGRILLRANATSASTFDPHVEGSYLQQEGNLIDGVGGSTAFTDIYQQMYATLCASPNVPASPWPGAEAMQAELAATLASLGSSTPSCTVVFADGFESGDFGAWSATPIRFRATERARAAWSTDRRRPAIR